MLKTVILSLLMMTFASVLALAQASSSYSEIQDNATSGLTSTEKPPEFEGIGIDEKLGAKLDLNLPVKDETGKTVPLGTFFKGNKPVILSLVYFACPGLCNYHLNGLTEGLKKMEWSVGQNFEVISMSFDPKETSAVASQKKEAYLKLYGRPSAENSWHFLTADADTIKKITETVGFKYKWDEKNKDWAHASAATIVSPEGKISRYLHGIIFEPRDVKLALIDAVNGKTKSVADRLVWYCFQYDSHKSKYSLMAFRLVQFGGGLIILILAAFLLPFYLRSRRSKSGQWTEKTAAAKV